MEQKPMYKFLTVFGLFVKLFAIIVAFIINWEAALIMIAGFVFSDIMNIFIAYKKYKKVKDLSLEETTNKLNDLLSKYGMQFSLKNDLKSEIKNDDYIAITNDVNIKDAPGKLITSETNVNKPKKSKNKKVNK